MYTTEDLGGKKTRDSSKRVWQTFNSLSAVFLSSTSIDVMSAEPKGKWEEGRRKGKSLRLGEKK